MSEQASTNMLLLDKMTLLLNEIVDWLNSATRAALTPGQQVAEEDRLRQAWNSRVLTSFLRACREAVSVPGPKGLTAIRRWRDARKRAAERLIKKLVGVSSDNPEGDTIVRWQIFWFEVVEAWAETLAMNRNAPVQWLPDPTGNNAIPVPEDIRAVVAQFPPAFYADLKEQLLLAPDDPSSSAKQETDSYFPEVVPPLEIATHRFTIVTAPDTEEVNKRDSFSAFLDPAQVFLRILDADFQSIFGDAAVLITEAFHDRKQIERLGNTRVIIMPVDHQNPVPKPLCLHGNSAGGALLRVHFKHFSLEPGDDMNSLWTSLALRKNSKHSPDGMAYPIGGAEGKLIEVADAPDRGLDPKTLVFADTQRGENGGSINDLKREAQRRGINLRCTAKVSGVFDAGDRNETSMTEQFFYPNDPKEPNPKFLGRDTDMVELRAALRNEQSRIVVLHGPRSVGKSELLLNISRELHHSAHFSKGVLLDMAATDMLNEWPFQISNAFSQAVPVLASLSLPIATSGILTPAQGEKTLSVLLRALRQTGKRHLIVLENFEKALDAHGRVSDPLLLFLMQQLSERNDGVHLLLLSKSNPHLASALMQTVNDLNIEGLNSLDAVKVLLSLESRHDGPLHTTPEDDLKRLAEHVQCIPGLLRNIAGRMRLNPDMNVDDLLQNPDIFLHSNDPDLDLSRAICAHYDDLDVPQQTLALLLAALRRPVTAEQLLQALADYQKDSDQPLTRDESYEAVRALTRNYFALYDGTTKSYSLPPYYLDFLTEALQND